MNRSRTSRIAALLTMCLATSAMPAAAQTFVQQSLTPDADALAAEMRLLAANPSDVNAMVRAGELTLKLDDATAAAGFFARAERIDPNNPRIKAGKGTLLVQAGRPGEALRLYNDAELLRGDVRSFAADRGLAYDLIGEQERAQRDYRLALRDGPADETLRRYALSLGISGKQAEALAVIDPLLRRSDRGAWRARAFILAMNGDPRGAERIAASMMPGGLGQGLQPFFDRLPRLAAADRAFAVHFGEVRASPQRIADARMTPRLPVLSPEPGRSVAMAAVTTSVVQQPVRETGRMKRERRKREKERVVLATIAPPVPLPQPPAYRGTSVAVASTQGYVQPLPTTGGQGYAAPTTLPPVALASNRATFSAVPTGRADIAPARGTDLAPAARATDAYRNATAALSEVPVRTVAPATRAEVVTSRPQVVEAVSVPAPVQLPTATQPPVMTPAPNAVPVVAAPLPGVVIPTAPAATAPGFTAAVLTPSPLVSVPVAPTPSAVVPAPAAAVATPAILPPVPGPVKGEDSILAKIIANITVPGNELDVGEAPAPETAAAEATPPVASLVNEPQATLIAEQKAADRLANDKALAARAAADKRAADRKAEALAETAPADVAALVRKPGESRSAFEARKLAAEKAVPVRRPGETNRAFEARKLAAARSAVDDDVPARKPGETARQFAARKAVAEDDVLTRKPGETARQFAARKAAADEEVLTRKSGETARQFAARKAAADDAALTRKPGETARQFEARKLAADKDDKPPAKGVEPARIWVQVAGGANEGDLARAWDKTRKDAPVAMRGRVAWTTPLRATNRVLTGPFKTDAEARALVNALGKEGVSAFTFTSEAGQKITRLAGK